MNSKNRKLKIKQQYNWPGDYIIHIVNKDIAIVEQRQQNFPIGYFAHVKSRKSNYIWPTFEEAILCAVSIKMTGNEDATEWMWKLVGGEK